MGQKIIINTTPSIVDNSKNERPFKESLYNPFSGYTIITYLLEFTNQPNQQMMLFEIPTIPVLSTNVVF
jgi:hypothetical protein